MQPNNSNYRIVHDALSLNLAYCKEQGYTKHFAHFVGSICVEDLTERRRKGEERHGKK